MLSAKDLCLHDGKANVSAAVIDIDGKGPDAKNFFSNDIPVGY